MRTEAIVALIVTRSVKHLIYMLKHWTEQFYQVHRCTLTITPTAYDQRKVSLIFLAFRVQCMKIEAEVISILTAPFEMKKCHTMLIFILQKVCTAWIQLYLICTYMFYCWSLLRALIISFWASEIQNWNLIASTIFWIRHTTGKWNLWEKFPWIRTNYAI